MKAYDDGYESYKPIRNQIRKYTSQSLTTHCFQLLLEISSKKAYEWNGYTPWDLLLIIKWVNAESELPNAKNATRDEFNKIVNKVKDFSGNIESFLKQGYPTGINKFMRRTAFQQFDYQSNISQLDMGRSSELFLKLPCSFPIRDFFFNRTGVSLDDFFYISLCVWTKARTEFSGFLTISFLQPLKKGLLEGAIENYLSLVSIDERKMKEIAQKGFSKHFHGQYFEQSPLKRYPLYSVDGYYCWFYPTMIDDLLVDWLYDFLKKEAGEKFSQAFGKTFEKYIGKTLAEFKYPFVPEAQIANILGDNEKVVDYLIPLSNGNILIEAKAIEAKDRVRENPTDITLDNNYKDSIVKAVAQAINVWNKISARKFSQCSNDRNFIFIVTYKELYLGNGKEVWEEFLKEAVEKYYANISLDLFDPSRLFFLTLYDLDKLLANFKDKQEGAVEKLEQILVEYSDIKTRKYTFSMYLDGLEKLAPSFVTQNYEEQFAYLASILPKN